MLNSLISLNNLYRLAPNKIIFEENNKVISVNMFAEEVASYIEKHQTHNKVIGILSDNGYRSAAAECGISATKSVLVSLPKFFSDEQLKEIIKDSNIELIYSDENNFKRAKSLFNNASLFLDNTCELKLPKENQHKRIIYTSGTTGKPKGVIQTCGQINFITQQLIDTFNIDESDKYFSLLPQSTLLEQIAAIHCTLLAGSVTVFKTDISNEIFNLKNNFVDVLFFKRITLLCLTPFLLNRMLQNFEPSILNAILFKAVTIGGSKTPISLLNEARKYNLPIYEGYGLSECCSVVSVNKFDENKIGSVGKPFKDLDVKIINNEIVVKGSTVMQGYQNKPLLNNNEIFTGDVGYFDEDGYLFVEGRKDEIIALKNGRNINPTWIEDLVLAKTNIKEVYAFNNKQNEFCLAVNLPEGVSKSTLRLQVDNAIPEYTRPDVIYFLEKDFIQNNAIFSSSGKIDKQKLKNIIN